MKSADGGHAPNPSRAALSSTFAEAVAPAMISMDTISVDPQTIIDNLPLGFLVIEVEAQGAPRCVLANRVFERLMGIARSKLIGQKIDEIAALPDRHPILDGCERCLHRRHPILIEGEVRHGRVHHFVDYRFAPVFGPHGDVIQILISVVDRTEDRRTRHEIVRTALHDNLTQLPNRQQFLDRLEQIGHRAMRNPATAYAVLSINLDRFKGINESLGHAAGDTVLVAVADRLMLSVPEGAVLARFSGDEFAVLVTNLPSAGDAGEIAEQIHSQMAAPFQILEREVFLTVSIGIAVNAGGREKPEDVMRDASLAMHRAKASGKSRTELYHADLHQQASALLQLENDLRRAISRGELELHYQPIVSLATGKLTGFEALARWFHPERGPVSPAEFIPVSEETGLIVPLGRWALMSACKQLGDWRARYPQYDLSVAVNVSGAQFMRHDLFRDTRTALEESGVDGSSLKLELTESSIMEHPELAASALNEIKTLKVSLALDDFGTGYSSLSYLNRFPIDILKIDRSFVSQMQHDGEQAKIINVITMLANTLGLDLIAEGVETPLQAARLRALGCAYAQGFLFSKPLSVSAVEELLESNVKWPPAIWLSQVGRPSSAKEVKG